MTNISLFRNELGVPYTPKPKNIDLKEGKWYDVMESGYSVIQAQIFKIRTIQNNVMITYRVCTKRRLFSTAWRYETMSVESFKARLIDLGSVPSILLKAE